jgi:hypothetical protein
MTSRNFSFPSTEFPEPKDWCIPWGLLDRSSSASHCGLEGSRFFLEGYA